MPWKNLEVRLSTNLAAFRAQMSGAGASVQSFGRTVDQVSRSHATWEKALTAVSVTAGVAVAAGLTKATIAAAQFEARMRNVASLGGVSEQQFRDLGKSVIDLSKTLPQSANTLAEGLYDIASSGFQGADGLKVLKASGEAASAGLSETATAARAITGVLNAYGLSASKAGEVSDVLFQTVNLGVVNFSELAGTIGDVVGIASQAGISIDQVGSAIATMTLSGVQGAESGTLLNRVIQSLLSPSDALKLVYKNLGIESGAAALKSEGLRGVMERLRQTTGGNVNAFLALFPDIRAARGAMALAANDGANYARVSAQIEDGNKRQGATHRALEQQLKSLSGQWKLFRNDVTAVEISLGQRLLPVTKDALSGLERLGHAGFDAVSAAVSRLGPFFRGLVDSGRNLVTVAGNLVRAFGPFAKAMAIIAGAGLLATLNGLARALAGVTGFLAQHQVIVNAVAVAYGIRLATSVASAAAAFATAAFDRVAVGVYSLAGAGDAAALSFSTLSGALGAIALGGAVVVLAGIFTALQNDTRKAKEFVAEISKGADLKSTSGLTAILGTLQEQEAQFASTGKASGGWGNALRRVGEEALPFVANGVNEAREKVKALQDEMDKVVGFKVALFQNLSEVSRATGLSRADVERLAQSLGVDLTTSFAASGDERQKLIDHVKELGQQAGLSGAALADMTGNNLSQMEALAKQVDDVGQKIRAAFAFDISGGFDPEKRAKAIDAVAAANDRVAETTAKVTDLERQARFDHRKTDDLAKARRDAAKATADLNKAQGDLVSDADQLATIYTNESRNARQFVTDVQEAARRGLDPALIQQLLEEGPAKAGPTLRTLVEDHSNRLIRLANTTEQAIGDITTQAVTLGRLAVQAQNAPTDRLARDISAAMKIVTASFADPKAAVQDLAKSTGMSVDEIKRVAGEFGITVQGMGDAAATAGQTAAAGLQPLDDKLAALIKAAQVLHGFIEGLPGGTPGAPPVGAAGGTGTLGAGGANAGGGAFNHTLAATGRLDPRVLHRTTVIAGERGPEAFIPFSLAVRPRAIGLLHETARHLGVPMANGGILGTPFGQPSRQYMTASHTSTVTRHIEFSGPIVVPDMKGAVEYAERQDRLNALQGV